MSEENFVDFKGWRFRAPFRCMCCGAMVSIRQFCFGRSCAPCDTGRCRHVRRSGSFSGPRELIDAADRYFIPEDRWLNGPEGLESHPNDASFPKRQALLDKMLARWQPECPVSPSTPAVGSAAERKE